MPFDIDPVVLGANITHARKKAGRTQDALAKALGFSRPTLVAIEGGTRAVSELEIDAISRSTGVSLRDLLNLDIPDESINVRFRAQQGAIDATDALDALEDLGRRYLRLENLANDRIVRRIPPTFAIDKISNIERAAEELAATERLRLGLGDGPLPDLRAVFEKDAGVRIFGLKELRRTKISGLFAFSQAYGPLIGFNVDHDPRRIRWTLCHEYAHFLTERFEVEVTVDQPVTSKRRDRRELFADAFAAHFLMPATGLSRRFSDMLSDAGGGLKVAHLMMLAQFFDVSFQAITHRLEEIGRISRGTYEMLRARGLQPLKAEEVLGIKRAAFEDLPFRYVYLIATLYARGVLSEGDVASYLRTDRLSARELLLNIPDGGDAKDDQAAGIDTPIGVLQ